MTKIERLILPYLEGTGFALWWAWIWLMFFQGHVGVRSASTYTLWFTFLVSISVALLAFMPFAERRGCCRQSFTLDTASSVILAMATTALTLIDLPEPWAVVITALTGICAGNWIVICADQLRHIKTDHIGICMATSFFLATILYFLVSSRPPVPETVLVALLPLLSVPLDVLYRRSPRIDADNSPVPTAALPDGPKAWPLFVLSIVNTAGFGVFMRIASLLDNDRVYLVIFIGIAFMSAGICITSSLQPRWFTSSTLFILPLPLYVIGFAFLVIDYANPQMDILAALFVILGWSCTCIMEWTELCKRAKHDKHGPLMLVMNAFCWQFGAIVGAAIYMVVADMLYVGSKGFEILGMVTIVLLVLTTCIIFAVEQKNQQARTLPERGDTGQTVGEQDRQDPTGAVLKKIAVDCDLSDREYDLLCLLAKGYNLPKVADEMSLAKSTIATHAQHLYRKCNVHTRQELIDLIESRKRETGETR